MKIATILMKNDYGVPERGHSFEYTNIHLPLCDLYGKDNIFHFDFLNQARLNGINEMNRDLINFLKENQPDIALFCLFENEIFEDTVKTASEITKTVVYFFDDPWRQDYVNKWRKIFNYFTTSDHYMYQQYLIRGIDNAILSPFGFNRNIYIKKDLPYKYDVSFVGGYNSYRGWVIKLLRKSGIEVSVFGRGWNGNRNWISTNEMVDVFNSSRINLNLSNSISYDAGYLAKSLFNPKALKNILLNKKNKEQVKGRHYEINACGGFQLSYFIPGLNLVYEIDKEIAVYEDVRRLPQIINYFLENDKLRREIADNGYQKSVKEHSAQGYLQNTIDKIMRVK